MLKLFYHLRLQVHIRSSFFISLFTCCIQPQDTTHLIQRPCYQRGSLCQHPTGNWTTRRPEHCIETQTAVVWSCLPFIRSSQNHLAKHSERGKKTRQTEEEVGRQHYGIDRKMEETGCEIICGAPTTLAVKK